MRAKIQCTAFKQAVNEIMRFPMSSALAGSELIFFRVIKKENGSVLTFRSGISVLAQTLCKAEGEIEEWFAVDGRSLQPWANAAKSTVEIVIDTKNKQIWFDAGGPTHSIYFPLTEGPEEMLKIKRGDVMGTPTESDAQVLSYLAALVPDIQTRPDLSCIMVIGGKTGMQGKMYAVACGQRTIAVARLDNFSGEGQIPSVIARDVKTDEMLCANGTMLTLAAGRASYGMALPEEVTNFPWQMVWDLVESDKRRVAECDGDAFAEACFNCAECMGFITKLGAFIEIAVEKDRLHFIAQGAAKYETVLPAKILCTDKPTLYLPIEEASVISPMCKGQTVYFGQGKKNKELHVQSSAVHIVVAAGKSEE